MIELYRICSMDWYLFVEMTILLILCLTVLDICRQRCDELTRKAMRQTEREKRFAENNDRHGLAYGNIDSNLRTIRSSLSLPRSHWTKHSFSLSRSLPMCLHHLQIVFVVLLFSSAWKHSIDCSMPTDWKKTSRISLLALKVLVLIYLPCL